MMKEFKFGMPSGEGDDTIMNSFMSEIRTLKSELEKWEIEYRNQPLYPGQKIVSEGKRLLIDVLDIKYPAEFFAFVDSKLDDFCEFAEDYDPIKKFFTGEQKTLWNKSINLMTIYKDSKTYIVDDEIETVVKEIETILRKPSPYSEIYKIAGLNERFSNAYMQLLDKEISPISEAVQNARERVFEHLNQTHCKDKFLNRVIKSFDELKDKAESCNNIAVLKNIQYEADALKMRLLNEINAEENKILQIAAEQNKTNADIPAPKQIKRRNISIKSLSPYKTWEIKSYEDIERYLAELRLKIECELEEDTIINVEF